MSSLNYQEYGTGNTIVLIHGFPFNNSIWNSFALPLSENFNVLTIDLPGFGKSPILKIPFSIDDVAEAVLDFLSERKITKAVVIGHSLGGYVALSMANKNPDIIAGLGLFHSTAYPDSEEKKQSRLKVVEFIEKNGVLAFTANFIEPLFVNQSHPAIATVKQIAIQSSADAVKGYTLAMRDRKERTDVIKELRRPFLMIAGEKDNGIPIDAVTKQSSMASDVEVYVLENVAHMGMFERPNETLNIVTSFATKSFQ